MGFIVSVDDPSETALLNAHDVPEMNRVVQPGGDGDTRAASSDLARPVRRLPVSPRRPLR